MNEYIREQIRDYVHDDLLRNWKQRASECDALRKQLEAETDPDEAWNVALQWSAMYQALVRLEASLLQGVVPILEEMLEETDMELRELTQQRKDAEQKVYDLHRSGPRPMDRAADKRHQREVDKAKAERNDVLATTGVRFSEIREVQAPVRKAIGSVNRSVRALWADAENRFPEPVKVLPYRPMSGPAPKDPSKGPLEAFADRWVERMEQPDRGESIGSILRRARNHPVNRDWDAEMEQIRQRTLEQEPAP